MFLKGQKVRVVYNGQNASGFARNLNLPMNGIYSIPNWRDEVFTIESDRLSGIGSKAYLVSHEGKLVGFVYEQGLESIKLEYPREMMVRNSPDEVWIKRLVIGHFKDLEFPYLTCFNQQKGRYLGFKEVMEEKDFSNKKFEDEEKLIKEEIFEKMSKLKKFYSDYQKETSITLEVNFS